MKLWTRTILAVGLVTTMAFAGDEPAGKMTDPVEILKAADAAAKEVKAVSYKTTFVPTGASAGRQPSIEAKVSFTGIVGRYPEKFYYEVKVKGSESEPVRSFTMGTDAEDYYLVDHQEKKAYVDLDPGVMGSMARVAGNVPMIEFVHATPFSDEINGKSHKFEGIEKVGGEPCYKVFVEYQNAQTAIWYFSTKDLLPRRADRIMKTPDGQTFGSQKTIMNLKVEKSFDDAKFKLKLPAGYEKIDDFAP